MPSQTHPTLLQPHHQKLLRLLLPIPPPQILLQTPHTPKRTHHPPPKRSNTRPLLLPKRTTSLPQRHTRDLLPSFPPHPVSSTIPHPAHRLSPGVHPPPRLLLSQNRNVPMGHQRFAVLDMDEHPLENLSQVCVSGNGQVLGRVDERRVVLVIPRPRACLLSLLVVYGLLDAVRTRM